MGWGLSARSSTGGGFFLLYGDTCARILEPRTTCFAWPTINPAQALSVPLPGDVQRWLPTIWCLGDSAALCRLDHHSPLDSNLSRPARDFEIVFPGDAAIVAQFGRAPLASPLASALGTGAASARPLLRAPSNVGLEGTLSCSFAGSRVLSPSSVGHWTPFAMMGDVSDSVFFFSAVRVHLSEILVVENGILRSLEPVKAQSTMVAPETLSVTI